MKKRFVLVSLAAFGLLGALFIRLTPNNFSFRASATCEHAGYHYALKEADISHSGHKEFWTCCKCHEAFLANPGGSFVDQDDSLMVGGLSDTHIAYLAPKGEGYTLVKDFEELAVNDTFGGWTVVEDGGNKYIQASGSGYVSPVETALLYNDELALTNSWTMSADLYLVGNIAGNLSFTSNTFSENNEGTFNKFLFWHTDTNNGYTQVRRDGTNSSDGSALLDCGWFTQHGFDAGTIGNVAHNAWFNLKLSREGNLISMYANDVLLGSGEVAGLTNIKDIKFRICMSQTAAEVRLDNFMISKNSVSHNFEEMAANDTFGGWTVVEDGGKKYIQASGSGYVSPVETALLFDEQIALGTRWEMSAKLYLVGNIAGNLSFTSNTFSENNEGTFNKFLFWHTDTNNGYTQVRRDGTNSSDGSALLDCGWFTQHGFDAGEIGNIAHNAWFNLKLTREGDVISLYANDLLQGSGTVAGLLDMKDIKFRICMSQTAAEVRLDDFRIARI